MTSKDTRPPKKKCQNEPGTGQAAFNEPKTKEDKMNAIHPNEKSLSDIDKAEIPIATGLAEAICGRKAEDDPVAALALQLGQSVKGLGYAESAKFAARRDGDLVAEDRAKELYDRADIRKDGIEALIPILPAKDLVGAAAQSMLAWEAAYDLLNNDFSKNEALARRRLTVIQRCTESVLKMLLKETGLDPASVAADFYAGPAMWSSEKSDAPNPFADTISP